MRRRQLSTLVKQEVKQAFRNRTLLFTFIIFPLFMWGLQGGVQSLAANSFDTEGEEFYIINFDTGNSTTNMGDLFVKTMKSLTEIEDSPIYGAKANTSFAESYSEARALAKSDGLTPMIIVPQNFTEVYNSFDPNTSPFPPRVELISRPDDGGISSQVRVAATTILSSEPYTLVTIHKATLVQPEIIEFEGETTEDFFTIGFLSFLALIIAVQAPAGYISTAFSGEREKRTMEALLALHMPRIMVLLGKVIASLVLTGVFALANIAGMFLFSKLAEDIFTVGPTEIFAVTFVLVLTAFVATGIGISIASFAKDSKTAQGYYQAIMLIPTFFVGFITLFGGLPEFGPVYLIPFIHSIAVLEKALFPNTLANSTITGSIQLDIFLHFAYLLLFVGLGFALAAKLFDREGILT